MMSFATDYMTAYRLLRTGRTDAETFYRVFPELREDAGPKIGDIFTRTQRYTALSERVGVVGRVKAAIYAVKLATEMRRQKLLVNALFNIKQEEPTKTVHERPITLFPITVNRTVVQMRDPDKGPNG
jgi:hypothetical protein